jgi:hypothetical protein
MQSPQDLEESVTVKETARRVGSSTRQADRFIQNGEKNSVHGIHVARREFSEGGSSTHAASERG